MNDDQTNDADQVIALLRKAARELQRGQIVVEQAKVSYQPVPNGKTKWGVPRFTAGTAALEIAFGPGAPADQVLLPES
jgi:hypothetical protein